MSNDELLIIVARALNLIGAEWMLTGSNASSFLGVPRTTHDIDFVIDFRMHYYAEFVASFPDDEYFFQPHLLKEAYGRAGMFSMTHRASGMKLDFWILGDDPFDVSHFERRQVHLIDGVPVPMSAPEDCILKKLWWGKQSGGSRKQFNDALQVYEMRARNIDRSYMERWVDRLNIRAEWSQLLEEAQPLS